MHEIATEEAEVQLKLSIRARSQGNISLELRHTVLSDNWEMMSVRTFTEVPKKVIIRQAIYRGF